jgi:hypothetical protein
MLANRSVTQSVVAALQETSKSLKAKSDGNPDLAKAIAGFVTIFEAIASAGHQDLLSTFELPIQANEWTDICSTISTLRSDWQSAFLPNVAFENVADFLSTSVTNGQFSPIHLTAIGVTNAAFKSADWKTVAEALRSRLTAGVAAPLDSKEIALLLSGLNAIRKYQSAAVDSILLDLAGTGNLMHQLHQAHAQNNLDCKIQLIISFMEHKPDLGKPTPLGNSEAGFAVLTSHLSTGDPSFANSLLTSLQQRSELQLLLLVIEARKTYDPLILRCLRIVADGNTPSSLFTSAFFISHWKELYDQIDELPSTHVRFEKLISDLVSHGDLVGSFLAGGPSFEPQQSLLYLAICKAVASESFHEWCKHGLQSLPTAVWGLELAAEGNLVQLLVVLRNAGVSLDLRSPYQDALVEYAKKLITGEAKPSSSLVSSRDNILSALGTDEARKVLRDRLVDAATESAGSCADGFFEMFGTDIASEEALISSPRIVNRLFSGLVRNNSLLGLNWLKSILAKDSTIMSRFPDQASAKDFRTRIQSEIDNPTSSSEEVRRLILNIANLIGITIAEEGKAGPGRTAT